MKTLAILFLGIVSLSSLAATSSYSGKLKSNGDYCTLELEVQNAEYNMYTVIFKTQEYEISIYNTIQKDGNFTTANGLFKKNGKLYEPVIGAAIFPVGKYAEFTVSKKDNKNIKIHKQNYLATLRMNKTTSETDVCIVD